VIARWSIIDPPHVHVVSLWEIGFWASCIVRNLQQDRPQQVYARFCFRAVRCSPITREKGTSVPGKGEFLLEWTFDPRFSRICEKMFSTNIVSCRAKSSLSKKILDVYSSTTCLMARSGRCPRSSYTNTVTSLCWRWSTDTLSLVYHDSNMILMRLRSRLY